MIDWNKQLNIAVRESKKSQYKHLVVKTLVLLAIKIRYSKNLKWQRIYSEFDLNGCIPDIYHENLKSKEVYCYEIQENITEDYITSKNKFYNNYEVYGFNRVNWILIKLKDCPDDLESIWDWVRKHIV
jgi:hypothetical protein